MAGGKKTTHSPSEKIRSPKRNYTTILTEGDVFKKNRSSRKPSDKPTETQSTGPRKK